MSEVAERTNRSDLTARREQERESSLYPPADVFEDTNGVTLLVDMPGVSRDRLNLQVDHNNLVVEGDMEIEMPGKMESLYADVRATHYRRAFSLSGEQLDTDSVKATLNNGVLKVEIPKRAELKPRRIEVKTG